MSEFYLVRHGQASFGAENYDKLSELGKQQSEWLGEYFADRQIAFDQILTGTLTRHKETADGIRSALPTDVPVDALPELNEFDFEGLARAYLHQYPDARPAEDAPRAEFYRLLKSAMLEWAANTLPEEHLNESWQQFEHRVALAINHVREQLHSKRVLIVSSGGAIAMLLSHVLGFGPEQVVNLNLQIKNTSFSHFYFNPLQVRLSNFNNVPHLDLPERVEAVTYS